MTDFTELNSFQSKWTDARLQIDVVEKAHLFDGLFECLRPSSLNLQASKWPVLKRGSERKCTKLNSIQSKWTVIRLPIDGHVD